MKKRGGSRVNDRITVVRRVSQVFFLLFILYGGALGITKAFSWDREVMNPDESVALDSVDEDPRFNLYLPIRSCKNTNSDLGVFSGCAMFMLSETLTYKAFFAFALPILVFVILSMLFGRVWCGWVCPMGFFQEMLDWLRRILSINQIRLQRKWNRILRRIRWGWLAFILLVSFMISLPFLGTIRKDLHNINCLTCPTRYVLMLFPKIDPTYFSFQTSFYSMAAIILFLFIGIFIMSFFVRRFWCRICPNGALLALFNKGCLTTKEKDLQKCTKCGICYAVCPMDNEDVYQVKDRKVVNSSNCVMCFECLRKCPEDDCLKVKFAGKTIFKSRFK